MPNQSTTVRGQVVGHPDKWATRDFLSFLDNLSLQFWFGLWEHFPELLRTKILTLVVIYWWTIGTWLLPIQQSDQFGKITGWPNAVAMPQVIHFRIKFFETLCLCFDCLSAHSQPSFLMCLYIPGPHYSVYFFNLPSGWLLSTVPDRVQMSMYVQHLKDLALDWLGLSLAVFRLFLVNLFAPQFAWLHLYMPYQHVILWKLLWDQDAMECRNFVSGAGIQHFFFIFWMVTMFLNS